jgi:hypothetical protein
VLLSCLLLQSLLLLLLLLEHLLWRLLSML